MSDSDGGEITELLHILDEAGYEDVLVLDQESADTVLTERRRELLSLIENTERASVSELATKLNRQQSAVSRDLSILYEYNVINFERDGQRKIPVLKYETILTRPVVLDGEFGEGTIEDTDTGTNGPTDRNTAPTHKESIPEPPLEESEQDPSQLTTSETDTTDDATTVIATRKYDSENQRDSTAETTDTQYDADALAALVSQIDGYEFDSIINIGRLGAVIKVTDATGAPAVIKTVSGPDNEENHLLIKNEIAALTQVGNHEHIVSLVDSGTEPHPWLVTEYVPHETLREALPVQVGTGVEIIEQVFAALCYAHGKQIPHGDLKPENILLDTDRKQPHVQIIDWGSALTSLDSATSSMFLTPPYAPPELGGERSASTSTIVRSPIDEGQQPLSQAAYEQVDVYQVGKLVYEILTGSHQLPAYGGSTEDSVTEIVPPSVVNETLPTDLDEVVQRALAADPADRYQTVQDFWDDLRPVIDKYGLQHDQTVGEPSYHPGESVPTEETAKTISIADIYLRYANRLANKGYDSKAQTYYEAALERVPTNGTGNPNNATVLYEYANFLADQDRHEQAIKRYRQALELEPERPEIHNNIAVSYAELEAYEKALAHCQEALKIDEERPEIHTNIASILQRLGRYDEAIVHYQRAIELAPEQPEAYNNWGQLLMNTGRYNKAAAQFEEAIAIDPEYAEAHVNYATLLRQMGREEEAMTHLEEAMRLQPEYRDGKYRSLLKDATATPSSHRGTTTIA